MLTPPDKQLQISGAMRRRVRSRSAFAALLLLSRLLFALGVLLILYGCGGAGRAAPARYNPGIYHHVQAGQTLWSIARAYKVDVKTLARINRLSNRNELKVGQRLLIPGARRRRQVASRCPCPDKSSEKSRRSGATKEFRTPAKRPAAARHPALPVALSWPIRGVITQRFNQNGARRHDGIDIAAPKGAIIRAAADGEVIFSDWGPGGYGRIVMVQHSPHLVTVYAHNDRNLVQRHQRVKRGQAIATVGRSGRATGYHLHFEIRFKTAPKPPFVYLPQQPQTSTQAMQWLYESEGTT